MFRPLAFYHSGAGSSGEAFPLLLTEGGDELLLTESGDELLLAEGEISSPMVIALLGTPANTGSGTVTVGPYTPVANSRLLAFALYRRGGSVTAVAKCTISTGQGWTERVDAVQALVQPTSCRVTAWSAVAGVSPTSQSTTFTSSSANIVYGVLCQIPDSLLDFSNVGTGLHTSGDPHPTLANAPLADSLLIAAAAVSLDENLGIPPTNPTLVTPSGYNSLYNRAGAISPAINPMGGQVCYRTAGSVDDAVWNSAGFISASVILEIKHV